MSRINKRNSGFTLVEMMFSMAMLGVILISFMGIFILFQRSSGQTRQFADTQQNARVATDYITEYLRQAGSATDYVRGQRFIVHAAPYQVAFNADIDNGQTIGGEAPLTSIDLAFSPNTVPASGTPLYQPPRVFESEAETVVFTLDSNSDGVIDNSDRGDDVEEGDVNKNLYVLRRATYGFDGVGANLVRQTNLALLRGPGPGPKGDHPTPLFQYFYDHDDDEGTPALLFGDGDGNGKLSNAEIAALTPMPDAWLPSIRKVRVTVTSESDKYNPKFEHNGGFLRVEMKSEVYVRNATRTGSTVFGKVFSDVNGNGALDVGEPGIPNVEIRVVGLSRKTRTNGSGIFFIPLPAGDYTIREYDPPGYSSSTPNIVAVTVAPGEAVQVDYGDESGIATGYIKGKVFNDLDANGAYMIGEPGLPDVLITLDSGQEARTNADGDYQFVVNVGTYNVVETDPVGWSSTTPNAVEATLTMAGDSAIVDFGETQFGLSGTIQGFVFYDEDENQIFNPKKEVGLANVTLTMSNGDSTLTNALGMYQFTLAPGTYEITERDLEGFASTTVNTYSDIVIEPDTLIALDFGDVLIHQNDFIEIAITNIGRALAVNALDFSEDSAGDPDIVVGSPATADSTNLKIFLNNKKNNTPTLSAIFNATPDYERGTGANINAISAYDFNADKMTDLLIGLQKKSWNVQEWWTAKGGGAPGNNPDVKIGTDGSHNVLTSAVADLDADGIMDIIVGLTTGTGTFTGGFEVFRGLGGGTYTPTNFITAAGASSTLLLGEVWALDTGDIDGDGDLDVAIGTMTGPYSGYVDIYTNNSVNSGRVRWTARYYVPGAVNALRLYDMKEDDQNDPDLLVGVSTTSNGGQLVLFLNTAGVFGVPASGGFSFESEVMAKEPHDHFDANGEVMSIEVAPVNADVYPDVFVGTRSTSFYEGDVYFLETFGRLPSSALPLNGTRIGEVVSMKIADFDGDGLHDVLLGTRTTSTAGKLLIYFYKRSQ